MDAIAERADAIEERKSRTAREALCPKERSSRSTRGAQAWRGRDRGDEVELGALQGARKDTPAAPAPPRPSSFPLAEEE